jgi:glycosyltransferase involved in cell wall biosynthesis
MKRVYSVVLNPFTHDSRVLKEALSLRKAGFDVCVVALWEAGLAPKETIEGISVVRIRLRSKTWSKHPVVQLVKYAEFLWRALRVCRDADIVHCHDLNALPVGAWLKMSGRNVRVVYDAHEYEIDDRPNGGKISKKLKYLLEKSLIRFADRVITVSDAIAEEYVGLYDISKPALVLNTPFYLETPPRSDYFRRRFGIDAKQTIFLYQGALSRGRGIERIVEAFGMLENEGKAVAIFMGYGPLEGYLREAAQRYRNIFVHEAVPPESILRYTASADFGFSLIEDVCLSYRYSLPNKMFEYLMAELPVIVSNLPEMRRLIEENDVGVVVKGESAADLKNAVEKAMRSDISSLHRRIKKIKKLFSWEVQENVLLDVYERL